MSIQEMANIAARYFTAMAEAMLAACRLCAKEAGVELVVPKRGSKPRKSRITYATLEDKEWQKMVETNSDTPQLHM